MSNLELVFSKYKLFGRYKSFIFKKKLNAVLDRTYENMHRAVDSYFSEGEHLHVDPPLLGLFDMINSNIERAQEEVISFCIELLGPKWQNNDLHRYFIEVTKSTIKIESFFLRSRMMDFESDDFPDIKSEDDYEMVEDDYEMVFIPLEKSKKKILDFLTNYDFELYKR